jgi:hypothetical protein
MSCGCHSRKVVNNPIQLISVKTTAASKAELDKSMPTDVASRLRAQLQRRLQRTILAPKHMEPNSNPNPNPNPNPA